MEKLIVITGATATGKTEIGIQLAKRLNGEIISADSMMVYKYMNVGTAKPTFKEMENIPHHLIDIIYPDENFDVKDFVNLATEKIKQIQKKGKTPIIVGGTWLYIQSLLYGISQAPDANWEIREKLYKKSNEELYKILEKVDKEYAKKIHKNDKKRIVRALEVYFLTGEPFSSFHKQNKKPLYDFIGVVLERDRKQIIDRIENRVKKMINEGLIEEVKFLIENGFENSITSMQAIGYKELIPYIKGDITLEEAVEIIIKNTKNFAKRQIRTFKAKFNDKNWYHLDITNYTTKQVLDKILNKINKEEQNEFTRRAFK